jgi:large subunit ribosomal protein L23
MRLNHVILGPALTEKSERLKMNRTYTLYVAPNSTKTEVKQALKEFYDVDVTSVRAMTIRAKTRALAPGKELTKRAHGRKVCVTLAPNSKTLDLASFKN